MAGIERNNRGIQEGWPVAGSSGESKTWSGPGGCAQNCAHPEPHHGKMMRDKTETEVKVLQGVTIFCQTDSCHQPATHLFRKGQWAIVDYCQSHAKREADRIGVKLPACGLTAKRPPARREESFGLGQFRRAVTQAEEDGCDGCVQN
jgi:hypothetical protein